jgi:hypothetical protein
MMTALRLVPVPDDDELVLTPEEAETFHQYLDEISYYEDGSLWIGQSSFAAAEVLKTLEPNAYRVMYSTFLNERQDQVISQVTSGFPSPIAYCFHMFNNVADTENQRLMHLRDSWEATIRLLHAIVIAEARDRKISFASTKDFCFSNVISDSVDRLIRNIEAVLGTVSDQGIDFDSSQLFGKEIGSQLRTLNRVRNGFSHSQAKSELQASNLIQSSLDELIPLFESLEGLSEITLMRVIRLENLSLRSEIHTGYSQVPSRRNIPVTSEGITAAYSHCPSYFLDSHMLIHWNDRFYCLAPLVHFRPTATGNSTQICLYKTQNNGAGNKRLVFDIVGEGMDTELERSLFTDHLNEIRMLFGAGQES